jgi:tetratricopeptide (TPR) repeat protein
MEIEEYSDEELLERGREAVKLEQWPRATDLLEAYVGRFTARGDIVPASGLASYALCLGHGRQLRRGLDLGKKAQNADPRNPHVYWCLAQIHLLAKSRKEAIDTIERGLRASPDNFLLLRMRKRLGVRQPPPIPFLDRRNALNVSLGRLIYKLKGNAAVLALGLV